MKYQFDEQWVAALDLCEQRERKPRVPKTFIEGHFLA